MTLFEKFYQLHTGTCPLLLSNVWDAAGASLLQTIGAQAIATSSASVAWSLGYCDGGVMPIDQHMAAIKRIVSVSQVPVTVDIEDGYSDQPDKVAEFVAEVLETGVVGINIEDGIDEPELLEEKITAIRSLTHDQSVFINARTDVYLRELVDADKALNETIMRLMRYKKAGANCGFLPGVHSLDIINAIISAVELPLNVMIDDSGVRLPQIRQSAVARISLGPAPFLTAYSKFLEFSNALFNNQISDAEDLTYAKVNKTLHKAS